MQRLRPQKLRTDVERIPGPGDRLTPYDLDVVGELASLDHYADGRNRPDLEPAIRLNQTSCNTAVEKTHATLARQHAQLFLRFGITV